MAAMYIIIYLNCAPSDIPHWAFHTIDDDGDELIFEASGSTGQSFRFHKRLVQMDKSESKKEKIHIGRIEADVWPETQGLLEGVPVSMQAGWNCQNWIMEALQALEKQNYLEEDESGLSYVRGKYQKKRNTYK